MKKTALVIGATRGIGQAIAVRLAQDDFHVFGSSRDLDVLTLGTGQKICALNGEFTPLCFDVTDPSSVENAYQPYWQNSAPDVIVYNAGIAADDLFAFMSRDEWDRVIHTNLDGFYNTVQPLTANMIAQKHGRIIVISSISGQCGQGGQVNYSASKAALIGAVKSLARELGKRNILVNAVAPGIIDTEMTEHLPKEQILPLIPLKRFGSTEEIAGVVSFLAGPDSTYITGQVLSINGGMYL